ncbi:hypothetical protein CFOL_v3_27679 [Cephalotus follicularis]|uniref:Uncharacterized protein n=1 Tax=Cephalotus follicularis TaxID=3775 RepID=A0A1Q3CVN8_CEPFO|nr:hypothetical protein CFOL_v3_27679 [Cephalotus follicularis]
MATATLLNETAAKTPAFAQHSPWHSPVPYLFGGLAAMLGLIAFALLILACSYWRLSGYLEGGNDNSERDLEAGEGKTELETQKVPKVMEEKFLVIMAGEVKPTFLATPITSRSSSFSDSTSNKSCCSEKSGKHLDGVEEGVIKQGSGVGDDDNDQQQSRTMDSHDPSDQTH